MIPTDLQIAPELARWILPASIILTGIALSLWVVYIGSLWLIFSKAGRSGWLILIPIVNVIVMLRIAGKPAWFFLLLLIPLVNIIVICLLWIDLGKAFGKGTLFGLGLIFFNFIFLFALAFGASEYEDPNQHKSHVDEFQPMNIRPT